MAKAPTTTAISRSAATLDAVVKALSGPGGDRPDWMTDAEWVALKEFAAERTIASGVLSRLAMQGRLDGASLAVLAGKSRASLVANLPLLANKALEIALLGEEVAGGDGKMTLALLKGLGALAEAKPMDETERQQAQVVVGELSKMDPKELREVVLARLRKQQRRGAAEVA